jgi:hypothetical protein
MTDKFDIKVKNNYFKLTEDEIDETLQSINVAQSKAKAMREHYTMSLTDDGLRIQSGEYK